MVTPNTPRKLRLMAGDLDSAIITMTAASSRATSPTPSSSSSTRRLSLSQRIATLGVKLVRTVSTETGTTVAEKGKLIIYWCFISPDQGFKNALSPAAVKPFPRAAVDSATCGSHLHRRPALAPTNLATCAGRLAPAPTHWRTPAAEKPCSAPLETTQLAGGVQATSARRREIRLSLRTRSSSPPLVRNP